MPFGLDDSDIITEMEAQDLNDDYGDFDDDDLDEESPAPEQGTYLGKKVWH